MQHTAHSMFIGRIPIIIIVIIIIVMFNIIVLIIITFIIIIIIFIMLIIIMSIIIFIIITIMFMFIITFIICVWNQVRYHEQGDVMVFDDSKSHFAFNMTSKPRVVLIVDIKRPENLPLGTATGGHIAELDDLIAMFK